MENAHYKADDYGLGIGGAIVMPSEHAARLYRLLVAPAAWWMRIAGQIVGATILNDPADIEQMRQRMQQKADWDASH